MKYTEGEETWAAEFSNLDDALGYIEQLGGAVGGRLPASAWEAKTKRGTPVAKYKVTVDASGWQGAQSLVEFDSGLACVFGQL